jgi:DNA-binding MarR family transcriptional regulator
MDDNKNNDLFDEMPFERLINNIVRNGVKYFLLKSEEIVLSRDGYYLLAIQSSDKDLSQDDIVNMFFQSKATVAKALKKLEDEGYITREVNKNNRRKYILKLTEKGEEIAPKLRSELNHWAEAVGIDELSDETMAKIRDVARKSYELVNI